MTELASVKDGFLHIPHAHREDFNLSRALPAIQVVIDALPYPIIVLDGKAIVLAVNRSWMYFSFENNTTAEIAAAVGLDYAVICEAASAAHVPDAARAMAAIRSVASGLRAHVAFEYSCELDGVSRRFLFSAQRLLNMSSGVVVSHAEITEPLARQQFLTASQEQDRFAADLQEGLCQELTGISLLLKASCHAAPKAGHAHLIDLIRVGQLIDKSNFNACEIARSLAPIKLGGADLETAVRGYVAGLYAPPNCHVHLKFAGCQDFPIHVTLASAFYRIIQEAVSNALHHSGAMRISVKCASTKEGIQILIEDDGRGFNLSGDYLGTGLRTMYHRAAAMGAQLAIKSNICVGTQIQVFFQR